MHRSVVSGEVVGLEGEFCTSTTGHPLQKTQIGLVLEFRKHRKRRLRMGNVTGGCIGGERCGHILLDAIPALHGLAGGSRYNIIRHQGHDTADRSGVTGVFILPIAFINPVPAVFSVVTPYPHRHPVTAPNTPVGCQLLCFAGKGRQCIARIGIRSYGIRRDVFVQIYDLRHKGILSGISAADGYSYSDCLGSGGSVPFDPDFLAVAGRNHDIVDPVGCAENRKSHRSGVIRCKVSVSPKCHGRDYIGIHPILYIRSLNLAFGRDFIKPDDTNAEGIDDVGVVLRPGGAAAPCRNAQITELQKHAQGQVLMGE